MGKRLAIRGHSTRGKEVIELLEMMGGKNARKLDGEANMYSYYLSGDIITSDRLSIAEDDEFEIFTIRDFLEKFPFKVHDLVNIPEYESTVGICGMRWDPYSKHMEYMVYRCDDEEWYTAEELLNYNDNPNEPPKNKEEKKINQMSLANCDLDEVEIVLGDKFELKIEDGKYYAVRKKSKYPTTYEECCKILGCKANHFFTDFSYNGLDIEISNYEDKINDLLRNFRKLRYCRDAYWKIAGEQMGLDKPWEPDYGGTFEHGTPIKYVIYNNGTHIVKEKKSSPNHILAFPTEEMRDAFYENFKNEIEQCKELL